MRLLILLRQFESSVEMADSSPNNKSYFISSVLLNVNTLIELIILEEPWAVNKHAIINNLSQNNTKFLHFKVVFHFLSLVFLIVYSWYVFMILLRLHQHITVTFQCMGSGTRDTHTAAVIFTLVFPLRFLLLSQSSRCVSCPLLVPGSVRVHAPYPAAAPITVTVTGVLWPRRSVSRSQQWKQSLSSTLSGPSRSQKKSRASWTRSTSRQRRRGEYLTPYIISPSYCVSGELVKVKKIK